jgi:protease-4
MKSFLKYFLAAFLAVAVFFIVSFFFFIGLMAGGSLSKSTTTITKKSVLQIDLSNDYQERPTKNYRSILQLENLDGQPGLYDVIRLLKKAKTDENISGVYLI